MWPPFATPRHDETEVLEEKRFFCIRLTFKGERLKPGTKNQKESYDQHVFFKSDRYSVYTGNLQVENDPEAAKPWKTFDGAKDAKKRLTDRGILKAHHKAVVVEYNLQVTRKLTVWLDEVPAAV